MRTLSRRSAVLAPVIVCLAACETPNTLSRSAPPTAHGARFLNNGTWLQSGTYEYFRVGDGFIS